MHVLIHWKNKFFSFTFEGWEGAGLGKSEQGIQDPIKQGEVRDKHDMFKVRCYIKFIQYDLLTTVIIHYVSILGSDLLTTCR